MKHKVYALEALIFRLKYPYIIDTATQTESWKDCPQGFAFFEI